MVNFHFLYGKCFAIKLLPAVHESQAIAIYRLTVACDQRAPHSASAEAARRTAWHSKLESSRTLFTKRHLVNSVLFGDLCLALHRLSNSSRETNKPPARRKMINDDRAGFAAACPLPLEIFGHFATGFDTVKSDSHFQALSS